jgi:hypothetical protein
MKDDLLSFAAIKGGSDHPQPQNSYDLPGFHFITGYFLHFTAVKLRFYFQILRGLAKVKLILNRAINGKGFNLND